MTRPRDAAVSNGNSVGMKTRLALFRALERLSDLRGNTVAGQMAVTFPAAPQPALWVYASTIGELNAIDPLLRQLAQELPALRLVLITDHAHYADSYRTTYPRAEVCVTLGHCNDARVLARHYPPALLVVAEIPCLPSDAPCRFSVAFLAETKRLGAGAVLVNGWLYGQQPACRMDSLERGLLQRDYVRSFDVICMQTLGGREAIIGAGAPAERVHAVGNIKFDAMVRADWHVDGAHSPWLLRELLCAGRPVVVAGCVTGAAELALVIDAFGLLLEQRPDALLVLAPRHPEVRQRMDELRTLLTQRSLSAVFRSTLTQKIDSGVRCLVLDTMGDLRDFYAAATAAHVGVNHNVLEPLGFDKRVTVTAGWSDRYPSYPVYRMLHDSGALFEVTSAPELARTWQSAVSASLSHRQALEIARQSLQGMRGSVLRHRRLLEPWVARAAIRSPSY